MARKGSRKVRTGCLTCKIRKVKCDEAKPHCQRCTGTGRACDGYAPVEATAIATTPLPAPSSPLRRSASAVRALRFFQEVAGPALAGHHVDVYFWNALVLQFSRYEPAVCHATIAVSTLYEQQQQHQQQKQCAAGALPDRFLSQRRFAASHYNAAIQLLVAADSEALALVTCVLFICAEFLLGDHAAAIQHCRHGVRIFNTAGRALPWARDYLYPIMRRLSVLPLYFGTYASAFPRIAGLEDGASAASFADLAAAEHALDALVCRAMRFVRTGIEYRFGPSPQEPAPAHLLEAQRRLASDLESWNCQLQNSSLLSPSATATLAHIQMQHLVGRIWVDMVLELDEMGYDKHDPSFKAILDLAADLPAGAPTRPTFVFEMGFLPLLYFVAIRCRSLELRLRSLNLMKELGIYRENLWDVNNLWSAARRVIEIEHDIDLGTPILQTGGIVPDARRIRDALILRKAPGPEKYGTTVPGQTIRFLLPDGEGGLVQRTEWFAH